MQITFSTDDPLRPITAKTTPQEYLILRMLEVLDSYVSQYGGTRDEALAAALDKAQPDSKGVFGVRQLIRLEADKRKEQGGFLATLPAGTDKWLPSGTLPGSKKTMSELLGELSGMEDSEVAALSIKTLGGTNYNWTVAKVRAAARALNAQRRAVDSARATAIAAYNAAQDLTPPGDFDVSAIEWPVQYTPAP